MLSNGANGSGVLALTRQFTSDFTSGGPITSATTWEHDIDSSGNVVRDLYTGTVVFATMPAPYPVSMVSGAEYASPGPMNLTFTSVEYDYANGGSNRYLSTYTYANVSGPPGSVTEVDTFDINNNQLTQMFSGFNPSTTDGKAAVETFFAMINNEQVVIANGTYYQYANAASGHELYGPGGEVGHFNHARLLKQVFSGLSGPESTFFSSYEYHYLGGVLSGSKYVLAPVTGQPYTAARSISTATATFPRSSPPGSPARPIRLTNMTMPMPTAPMAAAAWSGKKYYFTNIEGQAYTTREVDLDASGIATKVVYSGYTVTGNQPYSSLEYDYSGGNLTGSKGYVTNISGNWTGEVHEFNAMGQLVSQLYTGVTNQTSTSYEFEYANGDGVLTGKNFYFTDIVNQGYSSYEYSYDGGNTLTLATYNMNDGGHFLNGQGISQTINSIYNDTMTGGGGSDTFAFTPYFGQAIITDFSAADDIISLPGSEFAGYTYVQNNSTLVAGNMVITGTNGDTLTLQGVTTLPGSTDFLFV